MRASITSEGYAVFADKNRVHQNYENWHIATMKWLVTFVFIVIIVAEIATRDMHV